MTPKEKAEKLLDKFYPILGGIEPKDWSYFWKDTAKECALIAVDEIIEANPFSFYDKKFHLDRIKEYEKYWQEVKKEIEKL